MAGDFPLDVDAGIYVVTGLVVDALRESLLDLTAGNYPMVGLAVDLKVALEWPHEPKAALDTWIREKVGVVT